MTTRRHKQEQIKIIRQGDCSVSIYKHTVDGRKFYDLVFARLIKKSRRKGNPESYWHRGANFKPEDIPILIELMFKANDILAKREGLDSLTSADLNLFELLPQKSS